MIASVLVLALAAPAEPPERASSVEHGSPHFDVSAEFRPARVAGSGEVAVTFKAKDPEVVINARPAPRLKLDDAQKVLASKPPAPPGPAAEKYLDLTFPVVFPVSVVGAPHGQTVKGEVTYFYCSHREGWCKKGTADIDVAVKR